MNYKQNHQSEAAMLVPYMKPSNYQQAECDKPQKRGKPKKRKPTAKTTALPLSVNAHSKLKQN